MGRAGGTPENHSGYGTIKFKPGDKVVVKPSFPCMKCSHCSAGRYDLCEGKKLVGLHAEGCMREYVPVPEALLVALPEGVSFGQAATLKAFTVALNTFQRLNINVGKQ